MAKRGKKKSAKKSTTRKGKISTVTTVMTTKTTKTTRRSNPRRPNAGRRYGGDEWAEFILDGEMESAGVSGGDTSIPPALANSIAEYERVLRRVLSQCLMIAQSHLGPRGGVSIDEVWKEDAPYNVFMTLRGEGVGIWDGRWDHLFDKPTLVALQQCLKSDRELRGAVDDTGGGWLNEAFQAVAYERAENPGRRRGRGRRRNPEAAVGSTSSTRIRSIADRLARGGD